MNRTICAKHSDSRLLYERAHTQIVYPATVFGFMNGNILYNIYIVYFLYAFPLSAF